MVIQKEPGNPYQTLFRKNIQEQWEVINYRQVFIYRPLVRNFSYDCSHKRQSVPKASERPIHGLKSGKDFIVANAVDAILSTAKQPPKTTDWTRKKDYGKTPEYLTFIKQTLNNEYKMFQTLREEREEKK